MFHFLSVFASNYPGFVSVLFLLLRQLFRFCFLFFVFLFLFLFAHFVFYVRVLLSARFSNMGVSMVLVGETLMRADDPGKAIRTLLGKEDATPVRGSFVVRGARYRYAGI